MSVDTRPAELDALPASTLDSFRVTGPGQIRGLLTPVMERNIPVVISGSDGSAYTAQLWAMDVGKGRISLTADLMSPSIHRVVEVDEAVAVSYIEQVKLQFDLIDRVLVHGSNGCVLQAMFPLEVFRFQRRSSYRVRTLERTAPTLIFRHPSIPDLTLELRVLDLSAGGCALLLPKDTPLVSPGTLVNGACLELDVGVDIKASLLIHHVSSIQPQSNGVRLGCELLNIDSDGQRELGRYINQMQQRRRMMSLD